MEAKFESLDSLSHNINGLDRAELRNVNTNGNQSEYYVGVWNTTKDQLEVIVPRMKSSLVQHQDAFNSFVRAAQEKGLAVNGVLKNFGGNVVIEALFQNLNINDGKSNVDFGLRMENNYSKSSGATFKAEGFGFRSICSNGMILGGVVSATVKKYSSVAELDKTIIEIMDSVIKNFGKAKEMIQEAQGEVFASFDDASEKLLGEVNSKKKVKKMLELFESTDNITRYTLYNSITEFATFEASDENGRVRLQKVAQRILATPIAELKSKSWKRD